MLSQYRQHTWLYGIFIISVILLFSTSKAIAEEQQSIQKSKTKEHSNKSESTESEVDDDNPLIVRKIEFVGLKEAPEGLLTDIITTEVGEEVSQDKLSNDIKYLYRNTGFFKDVKVDVKPLENSTGLQVKYILTENPKLKGEAEIIGNEKIDDEKVREYVVPRPGEFCGKYAIWQSKQRILELYKREGFYLAEVETVVESDEDEGKVRLRFEIDEGEKVKVKEVNITGNKEVDDNSLRKVMKVRKGKRFRDAKLENDLISIIELYRDKGFMEARVLNHKKELTDDKKGIKVEIEVEEGPMFRVGEYQINLAQSNKPAFSEEKIRENLELKPGDIFNESKFQENIEKIQEEYHNKGYVLAEIIPQLKYDMELGVVDIQLNISEGSIVTIDDVNISGLEKTKEEVIRRELNRFDIKSGKSFNVQSIRKARQEIFSIGSFIRGVDFIPSGAGHQRDLTVQIAESPQTGMFSIGGGYGSEGGLFGVAEIGNNNLFGKAYQVHVKGEIGSQKRRTGQISFNTPWLFGTPTSLGVNLYSIQRLRRHYTSYTSYSSSSYDNYTDKRTGGSITVGWPITRDIDLSVRFKDEEVTTEYPELLTGQSSFVSKRETRSLTFYGSRDTRDYRTSLFHPISGAQSELSYEYSGGFLGADNTFQKYTAESSWYVNTLRDMVIATHLKAGYLRSDVQIDNPMSLASLFFERYFLGGIDTVRGYEDYSIVPDTYEMNGGNKMFYMNLEYRIPITNTLRGVLFFDMGKTWNEQTNTFREIFDDFTPGGFNLKRGIGAGVNLELMGMVMRLEYGYGIDRWRRTEEGKWIREPRGKFHFTIGPAF